MGKLSRLEKRWRSSRAPRDSRLCGRAGGRAPEPRPIWCRCWCWERKRGLGKSIYFFLLSLSFPLLWLPSSFRPVLRLFLWRFLWFVFQVFSFFGVFLSFQDKIDVDILVFFSSLFFLSSFSSFTPYLSFITLSPASRHSHPAVILIPVFYAFYFPFFPFPLNPSLCL